MTPFNPPKKQLAMYLIKNADTGEYLYYNGALFGKDYRFKKGKSGASVFNKEKKKKIILYFRQSGFTVVGVRA